MTQIIHSSPMAAMRRRLRLARPQTPDQLHGYIRVVLGFDIPRVPRVAGGGGGASHAAPFDYIQHAFFEHLEPRDCVVWASRGGGKTQLGAIATLMDMLFKPGVQIRILGGSFEQSSKMHRALRQMIENDLFIDLVDGGVTGRFIQLVNGSRVEVLSQSQRAVRGQRIHKLRCDEVELFEPDVWEAAQMVTRGGRCGDTHVPGCIEVFSTMHRPFGLMQQLTQEAVAGTRRLFRWNVLDVLEPCPPHRQCQACPLWDSCGGAAKDGRVRGHIGIDDAIQQRARVSLPVWESEMLCLRPSRRDSVYPEYDEAVHVAPFEISNLKFEISDVKPPMRWLGGMDLGFRAPTVLLWALHDHQSGMLHIVDELVMREMTVESQMAMAAARPWPRPTWIAADPAGHQRSDQTGTSTIALWRRGGWNVRARFSRIEPGLELVRRRLRSGRGAVKLRIDPRCVVLRESLATYHFPPDEPEACLPVKDGQDHAADALRYLIAMLDAAVAPVKIRGY